MNLRHLALVLAACLFAAPAHASFVDSNSGLVGVQRGAVAWGDYDNDGDLDLAVMGETLDDPIGRIYINQAGAFPTNVDLPVALMRSSLAWGDYDGDGDLDLAVAGTTGLSNVTTILRNDAGTYVDIAPPLQPVQEGGVAWGDVDNDGDLDLGVTGLSGANRYTLIYRNTGGGFADMGAGLTPLSFSRLAFGDYDNDGDLDLVTAGYVGTTPTTILYRNQGGGTFTNAGAGLPGTTSGSLAWGDYDNDADLDLLITGSNVGRIYRNTAGSFVDIAAGLAGISYSCGIWGDYDNDADLDLEQSGISISQPLSNVRRNDGASFPLAFMVTGVENAAGAWGDFDADGDLDLALTGVNNLNPLSRVYRNTGPNGANAPPAPPSGLTHTFHGQNTIFRWNRATDPQGGALGLTYNLRIGSTPGANDLMPSMSAANGRRLVIQKGNADHDTTWTLALQGGAGDHFYWSVQAIDQAFVGSAFASEQHFVVGIDDEAPPGLDPGLRLEGANPFRTEARLAAALPRTMRAEVTIHDLAGRRVATLARGALAAGTHRWSWRGNDDHGSAAASGVYLVRLRGEGVSGSLRILKLQ